jgi:uncharacterized protein (TIGR02453 family)
MPSPIFTHETFRFFRDLSRHNRKEWMDANRERYQAHVVAPFRALLAALAPAALKLDPNFDVSGRTGVNFSRINRDIRFAKDKTPYRPQMYLTFTARGAKDAGQLYVGVSGEAVTVGFRIYGGERDSRLARIAAPRAAANTKWLAVQSRKLGKNFDSYWYSTEKGEWTKHDAWPLTPEDWKGIKGWIVRRKLPPAAATRPGFVADAAKIFCAAFPFYAFSTSEKWRT